MPQSERHRVLFYLPWEFDLLGGVDVVVDRLVKGLRDDPEIEPLIGIQSWTQNGRHRDREGRHFLFLNAPDPGSAPLSVRSVTSLLRRLPSLALTLRRESVRTINAHFPTLNLLAFALLKRFGLWRGRLVLSFHGSDVAALRPCAAWRLIASQTDATTCCSAALANRLRDSGLFENCPPSVVYNGIDCERFAALGEESRGPVLSKRYLLNVGNFVPRKAQDVLISAFAKISSRHNQLDLVLVGGSDNGVWISELRASVQRLGLTDRVTFFENQPQFAVAALMRGATALIHPARNEPFGLVLIEAAACRVPVIATRVGGIPEIISSESLGALVEPDSPDDLAQTIETMLADPERLHLTAERLHHHVKAQFSGDAMVAGYRTCLARKT